MTVERDRMNPASGKMYKADGTVLDEALILQEVYDQITNSGLAVDATLSVADLQIASPDGGTTKLYAKSDGVGRLMVAIDDEGGVATEATLDLIKTAIDNINATVSGGRVLVTLPAQVESDIGDVKTAVETLSALVDAGELEVKDATAQAKLDSLIALATTMDADTGDIKTATEAVSALIDVGELKTKDLTAQAKLDSIITLLGDLASIKTAVEALSALVDAGEFKVKDADAQAKLDTANGLLATMDADTGAIKTATEAVVAIIAGGKMAVEDTVAQGKLDSIITVLGTIDTDTGNMDASLDAIESDADATRIAIQSVDTKMGEVQATPTSNTLLGRLKDLLTGIVLATGSNFFGKIGNTALIGAGEPVIDSYGSIELNESAGANQVILAGQGANKQIWVYGMVFTVDGAGSVSFQDEDDTPATGVMTFSANGGVSCPPSGNFAMPLFKVATNKALEVDLVTSNIDGILTYAVVDVS